METNKLKERYKPSNQRTMIEQLIGEWQIKYSVELTYKQFKGLKTLLKTMKHNCKGTDIDITRAMATAFQVSAKNKKQTGTPITQIMEIKRQAELYKEPRAMVKPKTTKNMNREIKFRAWDKKKNIFVKKGSIEIDGLIGRPLGRYELMQYTGLKDKNGVEIYEGDIVKHDATEIYQRDKWMSKVWYSKGTFLVRIGWQTDDRIKFPIDKNLGLWNTDYIEVIGNIYEDKEND